MKSGRDLDEIASAKLLSVNGIMELMNGDRWGAEGPPLKAYSRVTGPERFGSLYLIGRALVGSVAKRRGRCSDALAQHFSYLAGQHLQGKWLLQESGIGIDHAFMHDGVFGVSREVEHFGLRTRRTQPCG
jgi:hypothetical protein